MQNVLLLCEPGLGLAEAGGLSTEESHWRYEQVLEAKCRLVELVCRRLRAPKKQEASDEEAETDAARGRAGSVGPAPDPEMATGAPKKTFGRKFISHAKNKLKDMQAMARDKALLRVQVELKNLNFQFDDTAGALGHGPLTVGARLGQFRMHRHYGRFFHCHLSRAGVWLEPTPNTKLCKDFGTHLARAVREDPREAMKVMARAAAEERFRLAALALMRARLPLTDWGSQKRSERWQERGLIVRFLQANVYGGPEGLWEQVEERAGCSASVSVNGVLEQAFAAAWEKTMAARAARGTRFPRSSTSSPRRRGTSRMSRTTTAAFATQNWRWQVTFRPLRASLDDKQIQSGLTLISCMDAWSKMSRAFMWRPTLRPLECNFPDDANGRLTVARLWWLYALQRVLAAKRLALRVPVQQLMFRTTYMIQYRHYLGRAAAAKSAKHEHGHLHRRLPPHERALLQECEMRLPLNIIIGCYRQALELSRQIRKANRKRMSFLERWKLSFERITGFVKLLQGRKASRKSKLRSSTARKSVSMPSSPRSSPATAHVLEEFDEGEGSASESSGSSASDESSDEDDDDDDEEDDDDHGSGDNKAFFLLAGKWDIKINLVELRLLRRLDTQEPRAVLLHVKVLAFFSEVSVQSGQKLPGEDQDHPGIQAVFTVSSFNVISPEVMRLADCSTRHVCTVTRRLTLQAPRNTELPAGTGLGSNVVFAMRMRYDKTAQLLPVQCEIHVADLRVMLHDQLVLALADFLRNPMPAHAETLQMRQTFTPRGERMPQVILQRKWLEGAVSYSSGRVGPSKQSVKLQDHFAGTWAQTHKVSSARKLQRGLKAAQSFFEKLSGLSGHRHSYDIDLCMGAIHCMQVGRYTENLQLVEDIRVWGFHTHLGRGQSKLLRKSSDYEHAEDSFRELDFEKKASTVSARASGKPFSTAGIWASTSGSWNPDEEELLSSLLPLKLDGEEKTSRKHSLTVSWNPDADDLVSSLPPLKLPQSFERPTLSASLYCIRLKDLCEGLLDRSSAEWRRKVNHAVSL
eukprot:TRINITY_DN106600_c0_g1_i1.p1 TRINITY_DN106600_c0_g1~~TRINITY_DN106600_c0_g1_i1.p1  ORF type:complete len:1201 (+),score=195.91 TRINITY_DN106600_c0_g1_i1:511-3603(+)